jgi:hypothetical protein
MLGRTADGGCPHTFYGAMREQFLLPAKFAGESARATQIA